MLELMNTNKTHMHRFFDADLLDNMHLMVRNKTKYFKIKPACLCHIS